MRSWGPLHTVIGPSMFSEGNLRILFKDHYVGMYYVGLCLAFNIREFCNDQLIM